MFLEQLLRNLDVDGDVGGRELDVLAEHVLEGGDVLLINEARVDHKGTFLARKHIRSLDHVAHLPVFEALSVLDLEKNVLPLDFIEAS